MIEKTVLDYLSKKTKVPIYAEVPNGTKKVFILVEKVGSNDGDYLKRATIAIQSHDESLAKTSSLNNEIKIIMSSLSELDEISNCRCIGDYNFTDVTSKRYRYQALFDITYY